MATTTTTALSISLPLKLPLTLLILVVFVIVVSLSLSFPDFFSSFAVTAAEIPSLWISVVRSRWLQPPYLYLIINAIIFSIAASSRLLNNNNNNHLNHPPEEIDEFVNSAAESRECYDYCDDGGEVKDVVEVVEYCDTMMVRESGSEEKEEVEKSEWLEAVKEDDEEEKEEEEMPSVVVSRFAPHRRRRSTGSGLKGEKSVLRVSEQQMQREQETLETTWKAITEARDTPPTSHITNPDMWEEEEEALTARPTKEPSSGQEEELNRKVEAFIERFNEEMRLQRQLSHQQFMDMINRGT